MPLSCERIGNAYPGRLDSWRFRIREGVVKRGFPNFQPGGGFPDVQALGEQGASAFKFAGRDDRSSPALPAARGGGGEPRHCALFDEIALESGQSAEDMEISRPPGVAVSIFSVSERRPMRRAFKWVTVSMRCGSERPSRSNFHTTRTSPART